MMDPAADLHDPRRPMHREPPASEPFPPLTQPRLDANREVVLRHVPPTPTRRWPLIDRAMGTTVWVKHENHNPTGAFKVRGGLTFMDNLLREGRPRGVISASRGNHSQSLAFAGAQYGVPVTMVVPHGNSPDKTAATEAYGAEVIVHGRDFQESVDHAFALAEARELIPVPPLHPWLVDGVSTYAAELHEAVPELDAVYVPIGMGSGICANIAVRDLFGLHTEVIGVVSERAPAYALSFESGTPTSTPTADTFVDGVACRTPDPVAVATIVRGASRVVRVDERQAADAMVLMYRATHNLAEPAGALALAGALAEKERNAGRRVAIVHTGGNADFDVLSDAFGGLLPKDA
jgi:threonine dehydratase